MYASVDFWLVLFDKMSVLIRERKIGNEKGSIRLN